MALLGTYSGDQSMRIEKAIEIRRPAEDVWAFVADARNDPQWCHKVRSVEQVAGDGPGPQARYRILHSPRPLKPPVEMTVNVIEFEPPRHLRWREEDADGVFDVAYEVETIPGATRLTQVDDIDWKIPKLALPVERLMVGCDLSRQLAALKRLLER
jgi:uncharacterized membrane protein